jgi:V/A-type H+/Na+-transporting ATPase subunit B
LHHQPEAYGIAYKGVKEIKGSLLFLEGVHDVGFDEVARIRSPDGTERIGRVFDISKDVAVIQILGSTTGLQVDSTVSFAGSSFNIQVTDEVLGRMFNGAFEPIDGLPPLFSSDLRDVNGAPINPMARDYPDSLIHTGISVIDGLFSLVRGQKLPIFSESGQPHNRLIAQILRQATIRDQEERFAIVFTALGLRNDEAKFFIDVLRESGILPRSVLLLNLASDPTIERLLTPRIALTVAEYLAFDLEMHVLTILSDMTNYAEVLRESSAAREEVPGRGGYPSYLYSDLASIYERAGIIKGKKGSLTQIPVLTMPGGDYHHPIPDLTGYITEGQIFLDKDLVSRGIYPPVDVLPSLSRLMRKCIGPGKTREDHKDVSDQLYNAYSEGVKARDLARIVGETGLSERERKYLEFAGAFEERFVRQAENEKRSIEGTLDIAWEVLSILPEGELVRIDERLIRKYHPKHRESK